MLVPDLAGWVREHLPSLPETPYFSLALDWLCEVLSPSTAMIDRADKLPIYASHAVSWCRLIDPELRTLEALQRQGHQWLLIGVYKDSDPIQVPPFAEITLALGTLWA